MKLSALLALLWAGSVSAQGTMQGIFDSATGLSWLPLTCTTNVPESQVQSLYPAYTIASQAQVLQLWADCGVFQTGSIFDGSSTNNWHSLFKFMDAMGVTAYHNGYPESFGAIAGGGVAQINFYYDNGVPGYGVDCGNYNWVNPGYAFPGVGTYMYQPIPEPSLLGLGLIAALLTLNWRKK